MPDILFLLASHCERSLLLCFCLPCDILNSDFMLNLWVMVCTLNTSLSIESLGLVLLLFLPAADVIREFNLQRGSLIYECFNKSIDAYELSRAEPLTFGA